MVNQVGIGIIGAGRIAQVHVKTYQSFIPEARLVAAADIKESAAEKMAAQYNMKSYKHYQDLLDREDVEAVLVCVPTSLHADISIAAMEAQKHVFCEKPMAKDMKETRRMVEVASRNRVNLQIGFMLRFTPPIPKIKKLMDSGAFGKLIMLRAACFGWIPSDEWFYQLNKGGGVIVDTLVHFADLFRWFAGDVNHVYAEGDPFVLEGSKKNSSPDNAEIILRFKNRAMGSIYGSWTSGYGNFFFEIYGTKGTATVNFLEKQVSTIFLKQPFKQEDISFPAGWSFPDVIWPFGYAAEHKHFVNTILGEEKPMATGKDGQAALEIVLQAQKSINKGRAVYLEKNLAQ